MPSMTRILRVATDVGGTFTDLVYSEIDTFGRQIIRIAKTNTTPPNFEQGILEVLAKGNVDIAALGKWDSYTDAAHRMLKATSLPETPWRVVLANDKLRARLELIRTILATMDYAGKDAKAVGAIDEKIVVDPDRYISQHSQS